jgi:excisionase family DNA binding protein
MEKLCIVKRRKTGYGGDGSTGIAAGETTAASPVLSFELTPQQTSIMTGNSNFRRLCGENPSQVFFNLHFSTGSNIRMLTVANVCDMLQVSKTTVRKLVNTALLPSVKIGRLRRFFMDDILDYLSGCCTARAPRGTTEIHAEVLVASGEQGQALPN